ncbi:LamG domain-containing protein [Candidatus Woesearchaeota archaeon]|nr:LamG domain-containing protein [Candidatus Woesearchaeota archaeon]
MADRTKLIIGFLVLTLLASGIVYVQLDNSKIRVDEDKTTFYQKIGRYWKVAGREQNRLFDGTSIMNRDAQNVQVETITEGELITIIRTTPYQRGPTIVDTYTFNGSIRDVTQFPIDHKVEIFDGEGYFYRYTIDDLTETGPKRKLTGETEVSFGMNMKVTLNEGYRWAWIGYPYGSDSLSAQYDIDSDYEVFNVRLFDPPTLNSPSDGEIELNVNPVILNATSDLSNSNFKFYLSNDTTFTEDELVCNYSSVGLEAKTCEVMSVFPQDIPTENLVLWIDFDGDLLDKSGEGNNIYSSTMSSVPNGGLILGGYDFDYGDNYNFVADDNSLDFGTDGFTVSTWSYWQGGSTNQRIITSSAWKGSYNCYNSLSSPSWDFGHDVGDGCSIEVCVNNGTVTTGPQRVSFNSVDCPIDNPNSWYHYVIDYNRTAGKAFVYVNGKYQGYTDISGVTGSYDNSGTLKFDRLYGWYHEAIVDEYMIFNKSLSAEEIRDLYHSFDNTYYWKVNDSNGVDSSEASYQSFIIDNGAPIITQEVEDEYWQRSNNINLDYLVEEGNGVKNCSLYGNFTGSWALNQTNTTLVQGDNYFNITVPENDIYSWAIECSDELNNTDISGNRTFKVGNFLPTITILSPPQNTDENEVNFSLRASTLTEDTNISCDVYINDTLNFTMAVVNGGINSTTVSLSDGLWNWSANCQNVQNSSWNTITSTRDLLIGPLFNASSTFHYPTFSPGARQFPIRVNVSSSASRDVYSFIGVGNTTELWLTFDDYNYIIIPAPAPTLEGSGTLYSDPYPPDIDFGDHLIPSIVPSGSPSGYYIQFTSGAESGNNYTIDYTQSEGSWNGLDYFSLADYSGGASAGDTFDVWYSSGEEEVIYNITDYFQEHNASVATGSPANVSGRFGDAVDFDYSSSISIPSSDGFSILKSRNHAYSLWIKSDDTTNHGMVLSVYGDGTLERSRLFIVAGTGGTIRSNDNDGTTNINLDSTSNVADGEWHHILINYDNLGTGNKSLYVDGIYEGTVDMSSMDDIDTTQPLYLGALYDSSMKFNGSIDELVIFNRILNNDEIAEIYSGGSESRRQLSTDIFDAEGFNNSITAYSQGYTGYPNETFYGYIQADALWDTNENGTIWIKPSFAFEDSLWAVEFNLDGQSGTPYDTSCGEITTGATVEQNISKEGSYALNYGLQSSSFGNQERLAFGIINWPRQLYNDTFRIFFRLNGTTSTGSVTELSFNLTEALDRTGITVDINESTARLYRVNENGGIYNDTSICLGQPIVIG